ncbi:low molecular weight phosphatase family protein [Hirschia litorea]|uniref:Low molecular weight phosphatase family protein n=1 Tax=Hirschia litorea TaxID=1199156 RepID=A0ABW2IH10_9PROT
MSEDADIQSVLFVCSYNVVRSPMAELLLKSKSRSKLFIRSAGVYEGGESDVFAIAVMQEKGLDLEPHIPCSLRDLNDGSFDLVVALTDEAFKYVTEQYRTESVDIEFWPTYDATSTMGSRDTKMGAYREVRDQLDAKIKDRFAKWVQI